MSTATPYFTTGVYLITNTVTGTVYVGSSRQGIRGRWNDHLLTLNNGTHRNRFLQRAWRKYGERAFTFSVVEEVNNPDHIIEREQAWLDRYYPLGPQYCYNLSPTAASPKGVKQTEAMRAARSALLRGRKRTPEAIEKTADAHRGMKRSEETRKRMSEAQQRRFIERPVSEETRQRLAAMSIGRKQSEEEKAKRAKSYEGFISPAGIVYANVVNARSFAREHGLNPASLYKLDTGGLLRHRGWTRITPIRIPPRTHVFSLVGPDGVTYRRILNLKGFCREHVLSHRMIQALCRGDYAEWKGWKRLVVD